MNALSILFFQAIFSGKSSKFIDIDTLDFKTLLFQQKLLQCIYKWEGGNLLIKKNRFSIFLNFGNLGALTRKTLNKNELILWTLKQKSVLKVYISCKIWQYFGSEA